MDTRRSIYEIENIIAKSKEFSYIRNIVACNVNGVSETLPIFHESDVLVCNKSGYLTEIEIKRSYDDFLADFKKEHDHSSDLIKSFYYCVPLSIKDRVIEFIKNKPQDSRDHRYDAGILVYNDDNDVLETIFLPTLNYNVRRLFLEQRLELARLEAMRTIKLKDKIINTKQGGRDTRIRGDLAGFQVQETDNEVIEYD